MTFWQENYGFIKDVYDMRHQKMMEWMENVERVCKYISKYYQKYIKMNYLIFIMTSKGYWTDHGR